MLGIVTMLSRHVARGELDCGYQVQVSHSNYSNKVGKQGEKGRKKKNVQQMHNKSKHRCRFFFLLKWLHSPSVFFSACGGCVFDGYLISRLDTLFKEDSSSR